MNREVFALGREDREVQFASVLTRRVETAASAAGGVPVFDNPDRAFALADVVIDFSTREACAVNAAKAARLAKPVVIGTTGLSPEEVDSIGGAIAASGASGVISANFSVGVNVFLEAAKFLQERLENYDLEMVETHHKAKKDAPSGTALRTMGALGLTQAEIPIHSLRVGDVVGDHALFFAGNSERIELTHRATSRRCFAAGALQAAKWVAHKRDGTLHDFREVLKR